MKKVTIANNYAIALKEVTALDQNQSEKVKETIKFSDRKHIHLLGVQVIDRPGETKNKVIINPMIVNDDKFEKLKKNAKFLGYSKLIVLHDGNLHEDEVIEDDSEDEETPEQIIARLTAENEALKAGGNKSEETKPEKETIDPDAGSQGSQVETETSDREKAIEKLESDYLTAMSGNKDELVKFMVDYELPQEGITNNEGRKTAINAFYESKMEELSVNAN